MADDDKNNFARATVRMDVSIEMVFNTALAIAATGHQAEFLAMCNEKQWRMTADPDFINYVKSFLAEKPIPGMHTLAARAAQNSPDGSCFPHPGG